MNPNQARTQLHEGDFVTWHAQDGDHRARVCSVHRDGRAKIEVLDAEYNPAYRFKFVPLKSCEIEPKLYGPTPIGSF